MSQLKHYPSNDWKLSHHNGFIPPQKLSQARERAKVAKFDTQCDGSTRREYKQRGINGLRGEAKRRLRSACVLLERVYTKKCLSFLTCTVPVKGSRATRIINEQWGKITGKFFQELKRLLERKNLPTDYVYVTELQPERLKNRKEVAPHLHIVFVGRLPRKAWAISVQEIRNLWNRIISNHYEGKFDGSASTRIEQIKHSVRNYLTKYMTKHTSVLVMVKDLGLSEQLPRQWWGITRNLGTAIDASIQKLDESLTNYIERNLERFKQYGWVRWYFRIEKEIHDVSTNYSRTICFGIVGSFSDEGLDKIKALYQRECLQKQKASQIGLTT